MILAGVEGAEDAPAEGRKVAVDAVFDSVSVGTTFKAELAQRGRDLLLDLGGGARASRAGAEVPRLGRADQRQFLCDAEFGGVFRRFVRLCAAGREVPDGAQHLFPHQRREHRPVRAHADHRRQGRLRQLPRGLHRAEARREPAARGGGRDRGARGRGGEIFHRAELVSRRRERAGRRLQLRDQARRLPRGAGQGDVDAGRDRIGDHLEISVLHPARRGQPGRVLFDRHRQQSPAGRHRHQDDPSRQEHEDPGSSRRGSARGGRRTPIAGWFRCIRRRRTAATTPSATAC